MDMKFERDKAFDGVKAPMGQVPAKNAELEMAAIRLRSVISFQHALPAYSAAIL